MDISKLQNVNPFMNPEMYGAGRINPQVQPAHEPQQGVGGINGGSLPYNSRIQPINYAEVTQGINKDPRNSNLQEGALGENALYVNGGRAGGRLNFLT